mmetsp:Transcript_32478/g.85065  ORF Transcript_32478/g.85065 Transcript_32478/m.85065 type:complete len:85 (-) Transcript_32478:315-569(-)
MLDLKLFAACYARSWVVRGAARLQNQVSLVAQLAIHSLSTEIMSRVWVTSLLAQVVAKGHLLKALLLANAALKINVCSGPRVYN